MDQKPDITKNASAYLTEFLNGLPAEYRFEVTSILTEMKNSFDEVIPNINDIKKHVARVRRLRPIFAKLPLHLRKQLKGILVSALANSHNTKGVVIAIFTTCLCLLEYCAIRNCDRSDLESEDVWITVTALRDDVLPVLMPRLENQRTNLPSLLSWSLCMLIFVFHACLEWIVHQRCEPVKPLLVSTIIRYEKTLLDHATIPILMRIVLQAQRKQKPFLIPPKPHTLFEMLFASAVSSLSEILHRCKPIAKHDKNASILEQYEPKESRVKRASTKHSTQVPVKLENLPPSFEASLHEGSPEEVLSNLGLLYRLLLEKPDGKNLREPLLSTLKQSFSLLCRIRRIPSDETTSKTLQTNYEQIYRLLLQLWYHATKSRIVLTDLPQASIWLVGFSNPNYECMSLDGFTQAIIWTGRFLTIYQTVFRSLILNSPHWFLQMISDAVAAILDRAEKAREMSSIEESEEQLRICVLAISRPFCALRIEESDFKEEMSRAIQVPLECILSKMAKCQTVIHTQMPVTKKGKKSSNPTTESVMQPALSPQLRQLIVNHLVLPMIRAIDIWALAQTRVGLRPAAAKVILKQILENAELIREGIQVGHKFDYINTPPAVGGLHVVDKLAKRKR